MLVAVQQSSGSVEGVEGVVEGRALLGLPVSRTEEDPLLSGSHLLANCRVTLILELHCQPIQFQAELAEMFVLPYGQVVLALRRVQNGIHIGVVFLDHELNVLLYWREGGEERERRERKREMIFELSRSG